MSASVRKLHILYVVTGTLGQAVRVTFVSNLGVWLGVLDNFTRWVDEDSWILHSPFTFVALKLLVFIVTVSHKSFFMMNLNLDSVIELKVISLNGLIENTVFYVEKVSTELCSPDLSRDSMGHWSDKDIGK